MRAVVQGEEDRRRRCTEPGRDDEKMTAARRSESTGEDGRNDPGRNLREEALDGLEGVEVVDLLVDNCGCP